MITKQQLKSRPVTKVTFELAPEYEADSVSLVSNVNGWEPMPFTRLKNGKWKLQLEVAPGQEFQFRYRGMSNGSVWWDNDPEADAFIANEFGTSNAVVNC